ncbi:hypothetical protein HNO88_000500 [Novosphingobium chloroacetimidivorans]|uniref:Uncharacterized protein n=1 Tax=Novosphingobium chloroacetimidivorans TaxID=1428314 RepID=A0A7W7K7W8_9SPHN|nr:hypothetical protein [Novosphingobium chloroacetimidivorans]MBB4857193.1 hypothetical protein [Novosphingobium chloroacetimidivorans]
MARSARRSRGYVCVPRFTVQPAITGTAQVGQTLTGVSGTIGDGTVTARQWLRNGAAISGATAATYVVQAGDVGAVLTYEVTAASTFNTANTAKATSAATTTVIA